MGRWTHCSKAVKTWDMSLTLRTLWKMLVGQLRWTISAARSASHHAGQSASFGLASFLSFLAIVSISLGVFIARART
jgi:regulator of sigma E protease